MLVEHRFNCVVYIFSFLFSLLPSMHYIRLPFNRYEKQKCHWAPFFLNNIIGCCNTVMNHHFSVSCSEFVIVACSTFISFVFVLCVAFQYVYCVCMDLCICAFFTFNLASHINYFNRRRKNKTEKI